MRKWKSTKVVEAEQIMDIENLGDFQFALHLSSSETVPVDKPWVDKHSNGEGTSALLLGWFVRYPDGYESWHPENYMDDHVRAD